MRSNLPLTEEAMALVTQFIRDMSQRNIGVFGIVYQSDPEPGVALIRNSPDDPIEQARTMLRIIQGAVDDGRVQEYEVKPVN